VKPPGEVGAADIAAAVGISARSLHKHPGPRGRAGQGWQEPAQLHPFYRILGDGTGQCVRIPAGARSRRPVRSQIGRSSLSNPSWGGSDARPRT